MIESGASPKILVAEDDALVRKLVSEILRHWGKSVAVEFSEDRAQISRGLTSADFALLIVDADLLRGMKELRRAHTKVPVILTCLKPPSRTMLARLAPSFVLLKPFGAGDLMGILDVALPFAKLSRPVQNVPSDGRNAGLAAPSENGRSLSFVGKSAKILPILDTAGRAASSDATVLLTGPSGSGKTTLAALIHHTSPRRDKPFLELSCGALPETLFESELFGHDRGAFTGADSPKPGKFELANGGTIFLDDVANLGPSVQTKLLRVLQSKEFERVGGTKTLRADVRIIAATCEDLEAMVERGKFRRDLFWRLNVVAIKLPSLAERPEDVPLLIDTFFEKACKYHRKAALLMPEEVGRALLAYPWPGNARELENAIERLVVLAPGEHVQAKDLPMEIVRHRASERGERPAGAKAKIPREIVVGAIAQADGNRTKAAELLGITRQWLQSLVKEYGIA